MGVISGIAGAVNGVSGMRNWSIMTSAEVQAYIASHTAGGTGRQIGNTDWSGSYGCYGHTPASLPGAALSFVGSIDGTNGAAGTAIVDSCDIECDIEASGLLSHTVNFSGNGALTLGAGVAADATTAIPGTAIGCKAAFGTLVAEPVWTDIVDVRNWKLSLSAANQEYVNSGTSGQKRRTAGNIDATISIAVHVDDLADLPVLNAIHAVRLYVSATLYWEILWGIVGEASDIQIDREGAAIVGATINLPWTGIATIAAAATKGSIKTPAGATFWPAA